MKRIRVILLLVVLLSTLFVCGCSVKNDKLNRAIKIFGEEDYSQYNYFYLEEVYDVNGKASDLYVLHVISHDRAFAGQGQVNEYTVLIDFKNNTYNSLKRS